MNNIRKTIRDLVSGCNLDDAEEMALTIELLGRKCETTTTDDPKEIGFVNWVQSLLSCCDGDDPSQAYDVLVLISEAV